MEALSPRSTNLPLRHPTTHKPSMESQGVVKQEAIQVKVVEKRKSEKEKNHASPPPQWVTQPAGPDGQPSEKYCTGKLLGKGGFAICYEGKLVGKKTNSGTRKFALKIVKANMGVKKMEEKFKTELQIHSKLRHPNIVEFHRAFTFEQNTYIVLELCPNGSIMDVVKKRKCLSLPEVRRYTVQICGAVKYMHARNVIHRDLKMGNLFLDHNMNIKIGDFGLAAVLVTKSEAKGFSRRTTLCGTPNYIAPEILEKGRTGGHDHKVDIWAIGVILFAMMTGFPPFASNSQDDIYRKVKTLDYVWPTERCANFIPEEAKSLVAYLLKPNASERPEADYVVAHSFFAMHGGRAIPKKINPRCCVESPDWLEASFPRGDVMTADAERDSILSLAISCGVGDYAKIGVPLPIVGEDVGKSVYTEFLLEEEAGRTPVMPLPDDMVYMPFFESADLFKQVVLPSSDAFDILELSKCSIGQVGNPVAQAQPRDTKSHAVHLRLEANINAASETVQTIKEAVRKTSANHQDSTDPIQARTTKIRGMGDLAKPASTSLHRSVSTVTERETQGFLEGRPVRPSSRLRTEIGQAATLPKNFSRVTRSANTNTWEPGKPIFVSHAHTRPPRPRSPRGMGVRATMMARQQVPTEERRDRSQSIRARIAATVEKELADTQPSKANPVQPSSQATVSKANRTEEQVKISQSVERKTTGANGYGLLIDPEEKIETVRGTKPDEVLEKLRSLSARLSSELENVGKNLYNAKVSNPPKAESSSDRSVVIKWVDYTNKFGIGYILANGSAGCIFNGSEGRPSTCVVISEAEEHLRKKRTKSYSERHQIVPKHAPSIQFMENCGKHGLKRVLAQPKNYRININPDGTAGQLAPAKDTYDREKKQTLLLWDKFVKYMTQNLLQSEEEEHIADNPANNEPRKDAPYPPPPSSPFMRFYQRLGNVGIWGFGDGSFQFNFPDHTKLVLSTDGSSADFYHLSVTAIRGLKRGRALPRSALAERKALDGPLGMLLNGGYLSDDGNNSKKKKAASPRYKDVITANQLFEKVRFARDIVAIWIREGGLGLMGGKKVVWQGLRERGEKGREKLVWCTVGAKGGDRKVEVKEVGNVEDMTEGDVEGLVKMM